VTHQVYLALGTNLGDRLSNLDAVRISLPPAVCISTASPVYETPPWGVLDQPAFLNQVVETQTDFFALQLLEYLKNLESHLGRVPGMQYGPRLIDLDILFYDDLILETPQLTIPHPRLAERAFVLVPLADLAPGLLHPKLGKTVHELLDSVNQDGIQLYQY